MKEGWKNFILQWAIPAGVFSIVLTFLFAGFSADIKREAVATYEGSLYTITENYARQMNNSIRSTTAVGKTAVKVIEDGSLSEADLKTTLNAILDNTDAYLAVLSDANGKTVTTRDAAVDLSGVPYVSHLENEWDLEKFFVEDDDITGTQAYVFSFQVDAERYKKLLVYYPLTGANTRKYVPVESEYDSKGFAMLVDDVGTVYSFTGSNESLMIGRNLWDDVIQGVNESTISRNRTKLKSGSTGHINGKINNRNYFITYTPVGNSDFYLVISFAQSDVNKQERLLMASTLSRLVWCIVIVILFVVLVTVLNVIQLRKTTRNTDDLKDKADRDQLTGLKNKVTTENEIKEYIAENPDTIAMLFLIDIDNFKKINDTMGHAFGDEVLRELGKNIGVNFRVSDVIGRTGGDEFTIFLKNLKEDANCIREAQKLVYFFRHFQVGDYVKYSVTASIGAAIFPEHGADFESLYKSADAAVYKSKKRGKNQLSFYDDRDKTPEEIKRADAHHISLERHSEEE